MLLDELLKSWKQSITRSTKDSTSTEMSDNPFRTVDTSTGTTSVTLPMKPVKTTPKSWKVDEDLRHIVPDDVDHEEFFRILEELVSVLGMGMDSSYRAATKAAPLIETLIEEGMGDHLDGVELGSEALEEGYEMVSDGDYHVSVISEQTVRFKHRRNGSWEDIGALSTDTVQKIAHFDDFAGLDRWMEKEFSSNVTVTPSTLGGNSGKIRMKGDTEQLKVNCRGNWVTVNKDSDWKTIDSFNISDRS